MKAQAQRMIVALALAVAAATALAGAAQAEHPNDRAGVLGVGGIAATQTVASPDWIERAAARALADNTQTVASPDWIERAAARALADNTQAIASPDWIERAAARALSGDVVVPNDRRGRLGVGAVESSSQAVAPDWFERAALRGATEARPDDRGGLRGPGMVPTETPTVTTDTGDGFRWGDAAFGAVAALGLVLLGVLAAVTIRNRSRVILP